MNVPLSKIALAAGRDFSRQLRRLQRPKSMVFVPVLRELSNRLMYRLTWRLLIGEHAEGGLE